MWHKWSLGAYGAGAGEPRSTGTGSRSMPGSSPGREPARVRLPLCFTHAHVRLLNARDYVRDLKVPEISHFDVFRGISVENQNGKSEFRKERNTEGVCQVLSGWNGVAVHPVLAAFEVYWETSRDVILAPSGDHTQ